VTEAAPAPAPGEPAADPERTPPRPLPVYVPSVFSERNGSAALRRAFFAGCAFLALRLLTVRSWDMQNYLCLRGLLEGSVAMPLIFLEAAGRRAPGRVPRDGLLALAAFAIAALAGLLAEHVAWYTVELLNTGSFATAAAHSHYGGLPQTLRELLTSHAVQIAVPALGFGLAAFARLRGWHPATQVVFCLALAAAIGHALVFCSSLSYPADRMTLGIGILGAAALPIAYFLCDDERPIP